MTAAKLARSLAMASVFAATASGAAPGTMTGAQAPESRAAEESLVATIKDRFRAIENCFRTVAVDAVVEVAELGGTAVVPPRQTSVRWQTRGGRTLVEFDGFDLDRPSPVGDPVRRKRLYLPGGMTESVDLRTGSLAREQRSYLDATALTSDLGAGEFLSGFCGSYRSAILEGRRPRVTSVTGSGLARRVELTADDDSGTQRIVFRCAEEWGYLPAVSSMLVREGSAWVERRRIEVVSARFTRLGWAPASGNLVAWRPDGAGEQPFRRLAARFEFEPPDLTEVLVPRSLATAPAETRSSEPPASRGKDLDGFLSALGAVRNPFGPHAESGGGVAIAAAALAIAGGLVALQRRSQALLLGTIALSAAMLAWTTVAAIEEVRSGGEPAYPAIAGGDAIASRPPPWSRGLCGVDCLYLLTALVRRDRPDYARLLALVRPGAHGATLESLCIAAECLDLCPRLFNPRSLADPGAPLLGHVAPTHFVVVVPLADGRVAIVDPGRGIVRAEWDLVRRALSPLALCIAGGGAS